MAISLFIEFDGRARDRAATPDDWLAEIGDPLTAVPGFSSIELYTPADAHHPCPADRRPPPLIAQLRFSSLEAASHAAVCEEFAGALDEITAFSGAVRPRALDLVEGRLFAEAGESDPLASEIAIAYLVHYRRPAEDEAAFVRYYLDHHPSIMAELPGLGRLEIYTPVPLPRNPPMPSAKSMLICDVSFDSAAALGAALESDVRTRLREDFQSFPPYSGPVTHFAMKRVRISA